MVAFLGAISRTVGFLVTDQAPVAVDAVHGAGVERLRWQGYVGGYRLECDGNAAR